MKHAYRAQTHRIWNGCSIFLSNFTTFTAIRLRIEIIWRTDSINWQIGKCQALCFDSGFHQFIIKLNYFWMISYCYTQLVLALPLTHWHLSQMASPYNSYTPSVYTILIHVRRIVYLLLLVISNFLQEFIRCFSSPHSMCRWFRLKCILCVCVCFELMKEVLCLLSNEQLLIVVHLITTDSDQSKSSGLFNKRWAILWYCCYVSLSPSFLGVGVPFFHAYIFVIKLLLFLFVWILSKCRLLICLSSFVNAEIYAILSSRLNMDTTPEMHAILAVSFAE